MLALFGIAALQSQTFALSALDLSTMSNGWGRPGVDRSIQGTPLTLGGRTFARGIGAHAPSRINLRLVRPTRFTATVGVDDETKGKGSVEFVAVVDGKVRWRSGVVRGGTAPKTVDLDLNGAQSLSLQVTDGGDGASYDHADWGEPTVTADAPPQPVRDIQPIRIETANAALALYVDDEGHLRQRAFGSKQADEAEGQIAFPAAGDGWTFEPALQVTHADGNTSTDLRFVRQTRTGNLTRITLRDPAYPLDVDLCFRTFAADDVIEAWTEVRHAERRPITLSGFASSAPDLGTGEQYLTQFQGDWSREAGMEESRLPTGITVLDSKLGVRAHQFRAPYFMIARGGPAQEDTGEVLGGALAWSGSFRFAFEKLPDGRVRANCGMNPYASAYRLPAGETFATPKMVWVWSGRGTGEMSRKMHRYVRTQVLRDGDQPRAILLNNWESTYFDFDERKLVSLFSGARDLGIELFLLDDGWFGTKYPRNGDTQGLGDWAPNPKKLPRGLGPLADAAVERGLRFGLWFEPEMVNPRSELFERHPDWLIRQPKRPFDLQRNQMVLDLTNPKVAEFAYQTVHQALAKNPGITYVKWDCNRYLTQPGSPFLPADRQSELWIRYVRNLYAIMDRLAKAHPKVEIMMCSGGGGRVDLGALQFAHEYWPSDQTDPAKRITIQWGYSYFLPPIASANHVTRAGDHGLQYAFDVAMSGVLGMDIDVDRLTPAERSLSQVAVSRYKSIRDVVQLGDQYRLESPYAGPRSTMMNVYRDRAVVFVYSTGASPARALRLKGLDASRRYRLVGSDRVLSGASLMSEGLPVEALGAFTSRVVELRAE